MKTKIGAVAALLWTLGAGIAAARGTDLEFYTGVDLYAQCAASAADADFAARSGRCIGYVIGVSDTVQAAQSAGSGASVCIGPANAAPQLVQAVRRYLAAHPDKRGVAAHDLVVNALTAAFPCR